MKLRNTLITLILCFFLTGCITLLESLMPKVTPQQVSVIMAKADKVKFKKTKSLKTSGKDRLRLKSGQWVTTLTRNKTGDMDVSLTTTKILNVTGSTVVLETESYSAASDGERTVAQMTIENYPVKAKLSYSNAEYDRFIQNMKITRMISKTGSNPPQEVPAQTLSMMQGSAKGMFTNSIRMGDMRRTGCKTDYIKSSRCYDYDFSASAMGVSIKGVVTSHSAIPVNGLVKMATDRMTQETIAFGYKGARSLIH